MSASSGNRRKLLHTSKPTPIRAGQNWRADCIICPLCYCRRVALSGGENPSRLRRDGREAEGAPLLREYGLIAHRGFESLSLRHIHVLSLCKKGLFLIFSSSGPPLGPPSLPRLMAVPDPHGTHGALAKNRGYPPPREGTKNRLRAPWRPRHASPGPPCSLSAPSAFYAPHGHRSPQPFPPGLGLLPVLWPMPPPTRCYNVTN
jgi:hypothetical protein